MPVNSVFDCVNPLLSCLPEVFSFSAAAGSLVIAAGTVARKNISEGMRASIRRWRGGINDRFNNIDTLVNTVRKNQATWKMPSDLFTQLTDNYAQLQAVISKCHTSTVSPADRNLRNMLLGSTVSLCLFQVKIWAYGQFMAGVLKENDVYTLGFLLPGEIGGYRKRTKATSVVADVKVNVITGDVIRVVIDRASEENAAQVSRGWPEGVHNALIVITAADGHTEVLRKYTTRLYNSIDMPAGSHGKQFIVKASFLKHVDDPPRFSNGTVFSLPLSTRDLLASLSRRNQEDAGTQLSEVERQRQEIERQRQEIQQLKAELAAARK